MVPRGARTVSVDATVPETKRLVGLIVVLMLEELEEFVSDTGPVNPPNGAIEIVELLDGPPARTLRKKGLAESANPGPRTLTSISRKRKREPLLPNTSSV